MPSTIIIPIDIIHMFLRSDPEYARYVDHEKVSSFLKNALNFGLFQNAYTLEMRQGGLDLYKHTNLIGRINYSIEYARFINFFGTTNEWQQNEAYFTLKCNEAIQRIMDKLQRKQRDAVAYSMRERLSKDNPYYEDRNSTIQVMQYLGIHKPKPKNWIDILYPSPPKAGDKRKNPFIEQDERAKRRRLKGGLFNFFTKS